MDFDFSLNTIMAGFIFGVLGMYLIKRGKQTARPQMAMIGLVLIVYPYFITQVLLIWIVGIALLYLAYYLR